MLALVLAVVDGVADLVRAPSRLRWIEHELRSVGREVDELTARVAEFDVKGKRPARAGRTSRP